MDSLNRNCQGDETKDTRCPGCPLDQFNMRCQRYQDYLKSDHWFNLRKEAVTRWGDRCINCAVPKVEVHHLNYRNLLDVTTDDLMPLCRRCHQAVHDSDVIWRMWLDDGCSDNKRRRTIEFLAIRDETLRVAMNKMNADKPGRDSGVFRKEKKRRKRRYKAFSAKSAWVSKYGKSRSV